MFCAVVAGSDTNTVCWTKPIAKAPATTLIRYRAPAILANWRGDAPPTESMKALLDSCGDMRHYNATERGTAGVDRTYRRGRLSHGKGGAHFPRVAGAAHSVWVSGPGRIVGGRATLAGVGVPVARFEVRIPDEVLADLRARIRNTRWPDPAPGEPWSQGTDLDHLRGLLAYWADGFDWRARE